MTQKKVRIVDLASILGLVLCFAMCAYGIIDNAGIQNINRYLDPPSAIITFGGAFFAILLNSVCPLSRIDDNLLC